MSPIDDEAPYRIQFPSPSSFKDPFSRNADLTGRDWYVTHSTRPVWGDKRSVSLKVVGTSPAEQELHYTYKEVNSRSYHRSVFGGQPREGWGILGTGVGCMPSYLKVTKYGIEDSAGEVRPTWTPPRWAVLIFRDEAGNLAGLDLLCDHMFGCDMSNAVTEVCKKDKELQTNALGLYRVSTGW